MASDMNRNSGAALASLGLLPEKLAEEYPPRWQWTVSLLLGATLSGGPGLADLIAHLRSPQSTGVPPWVALSLGLAALELAYLVFLLQVRQRAAFRCVAAVLLAMAMASASLLGVSLLASVDNPLLVYLGLNVSFANTRLACFLLTSIHTIGALAVERFAPKPRLA
jgi:hypothetical protein